MALRKFVPTDTPEIHRIYNASKLDELRGEAREFSLLPLYQDQKRSQALWESDIYVYEQDIILGYGALHCNEVRALFVDPGSRGLGIGMCLLGHMLGQINGTGILYVAASNAAAIRLYERYGFSIAETFLTDYNGVPVNAHRMVRSGS